MQTSEPFSNSLSRPFWAGASVGLGVWQLQRLEWKEGIIARIEARTERKPMELEKAIELAREAAISAYYPGPRRGAVPPQPASAISMRCRMTGSPGWHVITPLETVDGTVVLVDRGFVPNSFTGPLQPPPRSDRAGSDRQLASCARPRSRASFIPDNDLAANQWFSRDLAAMARSMFPRGTVQVAPFFLEAEASDVPGGWPEGGQTRLELRQQPPAICHDVVRPRALPGRDLRRLCSWRFPGPAVLTSPSRPCCGGRALTARVQPEKPLFGERQVLKFISTRGEAPALSFEGALLAALAPDGGLFMPEAWPRLANRTRSPRLPASTTRTPPYRVMSPYLAGDPCAEDLQSVLAEAYDGFHHPAIVPLSQIGPNVFVLELFHGPTLAFKDLRCRWFRG